MLGVDSATWDRETVNLRNRLDQELMPNGWNYSDMCTLLGLSPQNFESTIPKRSKSIASGNEIFLSTEYINGGRQQNIHADQATGLWTSAIDASIQLKLHEALDDLYIRLHFSASFLATAGSQHVSISINGHSFFNGNLTDWNPHTASGTVPHSAENRALFIRIRCSYTVVPEQLGISGDSRSLGVFLGSILLESCPSYLEDDFKS